MTLLLFWRLAPLIVPAVQSFQLQASLVRCRGRVSGWLAASRFHTPPPSSPLLPSSLALPHGTHRTRLFVTTSSSLSNSFINESFAMASPSDDDHDDREEALLRFPPEWLERDTYNGISLRLDTAVNEPANNILQVDSFRVRLQESLEHWKVQGCRGIWIYLPTHRADLVPVATALGFQWHMVNSHGILILSQWLPTDEPSRLPRGPMYQVGVGCLVLNPDDPTQMLVVKEKTGPAAAMKLWKMPTGLADPAEDIHAAAVRELEEETGLRAECDGILVFRQSHSSRSGTRAASDLFFVCRMKLLLGQVSDDGDAAHTGNSSNGKTSTNKTVQWTAQPEEIAAIRWMPIEEYCSQEAWQKSPFYQELNRVCLDASQRDVLAPHTLALGWDGPRSAATNTMYKSSL